jgi:four helix bundle protein
MATQPEQLKARTKQFAIRIVRVFKSLPNNDEARIIRKQLLRAGTSVPANYRAVCRSRSKAEFISRMSVVVEEADETAFWLELLIETSVIPEIRLRDLFTKANELLAIFAASLWTARQERKTQSVNVSMTR